MTAICISLILMTAQPDIQVVVLPLESGRRDAPLAKELAGLMREVLDGMPGLSCLQAAHLQGPARDVFRRCGKHHDCRVRIGALMGAKVVISGSTAMSGGGPQIDLELLDVGSEKTVGKASSTLSGSRVHHAAALKVLFTEALFPERMVGAVDLFLDPPGGSIHIDGQSQVRDAGPQVHLGDIRSGRHTIRVSKAGYTDFYAIVQVPFQGTAKVKIKMRPGQAEPPGPVTAKVVKTATGTPSWYRQWWFWTIVGTVVVSASVSTAVLLN